MEKEEYPYRSGSIPSMFMQKHFNSNYRESTLYVRALLCCHIIISCIAYNNSVAFLLIVGA